uniref:Uncharacterized protein n=1 Tax=Panagrolaimus superbus TaxID=310955 RepID=A0A914YMV9_9BILA
MQEDQGGSSSRTFRQQVPALGGDQGYSIPTQGQGGFADFGFLSPEEDERRRRELNGQKEEDSRKRQAGGKVVEGIDYNVAAGGAPKKQPRKETLRPDEIEFEEPVRYIVVDDTPGRNMVLMREEDEGIDGESAGYKVRGTLAYAMAVTKVREGPTMYIPALIRRAEGSGQDTYVHFLAANEQHEQRVHGRSCDWSNGLIESRSLGEVYVAVVPDDWVKLTAHMALPEVLVGQNHRGGMLFRAIKMMDPTKREWISRGMAINNRQEGQQARYLWEAKLMAKHQMIIRTLELCNTTVMPSGVSKTSC